MATDSNDDCKSKQEKLKGFENWPQWANLMQAMLEEKEVWDIIDGSRAKPTTALQIRKKDKDNAIATKIISKGSARTFTSTLLEKETLRDLGKRFVKSAHKLDKELSILYSRSC